MAPHPRSFAQVATLLLAAVVVLAGCGATLPGTSTAPVERPGVTPKPTPLIDTAAGIKIAKAAVKALNKNPLITHVEQVSTGHAELDGKTFDVFATMSADFAGADMRIDVDATAINQKVDLRLRVVGKNAWVYRSGVWIKGKRSQVKAELAQMIDAVRIIKDPNHLRYFGRERVGKKDLEHFRVNRALTYESGFGITGKYDTFDVWVMTDGTPVKFEATFSADDPKLGKVTGKMTLDFTKFGGKIKVKAPKTS
jgi:hypothetical protein